jgi:hypothetical protein
MGGSSDLGGGGFVTGTSSFLNVAEVVEPREVTDPEPVFVAWSLVLAFVLGTFSALSEIDLLMTCTLYLYLSRANEKKVVGTHSSAVCHGIMIPRVSRYIIYAKADARYSSSSPPPLPDR